MTQLAKMQEALEAINTHQILLEELARTAIAYIDLSLCDYDVYADQRSAYRDYQEALANVIRAGVLTFPSEKYGSESSAKSP